MKNIFDHQDDIIRELNQIVNIAIVEELSNVNIEIDKISRILRAAKEKEEKEAILNQLRPGLYIAAIGKHWVFNTNKWDDDSGHYERHYYSIEKITKITDVSVFTYEIENNGHECPWITHHRKIDEVVNNIKNKRIHLTDDFKGVPLEEN